MVDSRRVSRKGIIRASTEKHYGRLPEYGKVSVSTAKWKIPGEYRENEESVLVRKNSPDDYRKMVESV